MGGELDQRQHVGAMSGSFAPLPDGDPTFAAGPSRTQFRERGPGCRSRTWPSPRIATNRAVPQPSFGAGDVSHGIYVREVAAVGYQRDLPTGRARRSRHSLCTRR